MPNGNPIWEGLIYSNNKTHILVESNYKQGPLEHQL